MRSTIWRAPPVATLLAMSMIGLSAILGCAAGSWILPATVALAQRGWSGLSEIPVSHYVIAETPAWIEPHSTLHIVVNLGSVIFTGAAGAFGIILAQRCWRFLVVKKLGWMTDEQVKAFWKRDPGF